MKHLFVSVLALATLAGCGAAPTALSGSHAPAPMAALSKSAESSSHEAGLAAGLAKAATITNTKAPKQSVRLRQSQIDQLAYDRGYVMGMLQGTINNLHFINGSFNGKEWKNFANMANDAMKEVVKVFNANPELASRYGKTVGILEGRIATYQSINRSTSDANVWANAAKDNAQALLQALESMK